MGDKPSFDDLYGSHYSRLVVLARLMTGAMAPAEEVVQDAFVQLYRMWTSIEYPTTYVRIAVVNGCRSHGRRQALERRSRMPDREPGVFERRRSPFATRCWCSHHAGGPRWCGSFRSEVADSACTTASLGRMATSTTAAISPDLIPTNGFPFLHYPDQVHDRQAESGKVPAGATQVVF